MLYIRRAEYEAWVSLWGEHAGGISIGSRLADGGLDATITGSRQRIRSALNSKSLWLCQFQIPLFGMKSAFLVYLVAENLVIKRI
jgi:hypothetical protein